MKKTILFFSHSSQSTHITGAEKHLLHMIQTLKEHYHCKLVVPSKGILEEKAIQEGVQVIVEHFPCTGDIVTCTCNFPATISSLQKQNSFFNLKNIIRKVSPQLVFVNTAVNLLPVLAAKSIKKKVVWSFLEVIHPENSQVVAQFVNKHADEVIGLSPLTLTFLEKQPIFKKAVYLPPTWLSKDIRLAPYQRARAHIRGSLNIPPDTPLIGYVAASLSQFKGYFDWIKIARTLTKQFPSAHFLLRSYAPRQHMKNRFTSMPRCHFKPFSKNIHEVYAPLDILVVPSRVKEGFNMVALEGMAFGKPIVAYNSGGLGELMTITHNERFCTQPTSTEIVKIINLLIKRPTLQYRVANHNKRIVNKIYNFSMFSKKLLNIIKKII